MNYALDRLHAECAELLTETGLLGEFVPTLSEPKPNIPADLAFPAFQAARDLGAGNPAAFAARLAEAVQTRPGGLVGRVEAAGPFVNFSVARNSLAGRFCPK